MGKSLIQQARGHGSLTYRVRRRAYKIRIGYPNLEGKAQIIKLINSGGHTAPIAKIKIQDKVFYNPAFEGAIEGQEIELGNKIEKGNIVKLKDIPIGTSVYNIEINPIDGGKIIRSSGGKAVVSSKAKDRVSILTSSKREISFDENCRATIGVIAGAGRLDKPFLKAGRKFYLMKARNKLWPRTSAVKMNAIDHPFGSGRGKRIKSKIAKRNAPPGAKVGLLRPRRTGRRKK